MAINTKGNANNKPGSKKGSAPAPAKKPFGASTAYAEPSKTKIPILGNKGA